LFFDNGNVSESFVRKSWILIVMLVLSLFFVSFLDGDFVGYVVKDKPKCIELISGHNDKNVRRINFVFAGVNYDDFEIFRNYVLDSVDYNGTGLLGGIVQSSYTPLGIFGFEPFRSNKDKFNFWIIDQNAKREKGVKSLLKNCKVEKKVPIIFVNDDEFLRSDTFGRPHGYVKISAPSSDYESFLINQNQFSLVSEIPRVVVHELGHSFGLLFDEYLETEDDEYRSPQEYRRLRFSKSKNCYTKDFESCLDVNKNKIWGDLLGRGCGDPTKIDCTQLDLYYYNEVSCFEGCLSRDNYYRALPSSIMESYQGIKTTFGLPSERILCRRIEKLTGSSGGYCNKFKDLTNSCFEGENCI